MSVCRFCLAQKPRKRITELNTMQNNVNYKDIILFCLGTQVDDDCNISTKLCVKCYRRTLEFHQFKTIALKSEFYLKSLGDSPPALNCKSDVLKDQINKSEIPKDSVSESEVNKTQIKTEILDGVDVINDGIENDDFEFEVKCDEVEIKHEPKLENGSDDELLSVIKKFKYEFIEDKNENDAPIQNKKGRPRKLRSIKIRIPKSRSELKIGPMKICEACGKYVRDLTAHKMTHLPSEARRRYKCEICDKTFASPHSKSKHKSRKHFGKKKECPDCHKMVMNLYSHRKMHNPDELKFECAPCGRRFVTKSRLEMHVSIHTKDRPFECHVCKKKFRLKLCMNMHIRQVHEKEKSHLCQYCSKSFFKKHHLQLHLRTHTKERPHGCTICGKFFKSSCTLKSHQLIHSDDKKFACSLCDMTFVKASYLRSHMVSHTKEKRYPCQYCGVRFHRSDHRKRHEFTAHLKHSTATVSPT